MQALKLPAIMTTANPIVDAEFRHQRFVIQRGRVGLIWIALAALMVVPALLTSIAYTVAAFMMPVFPDARRVLEIANDGFTAGLLIAIMNVAMYPVVTLVTFGLAANSINREKSGKTWDNLRLTRLEPRQIVVGKWWASVRALNGDHVMITTLRFGVASAVVMIFHNIIVTPFGIAPQWTILPILLVITIVYGLLDAALSAALGIAGAMVDMGGPIVPFILFCVRVVTAFAALLLWLGTLFVMPYGIGFISLISLMGFIAYGLVIWVVLRIAQTLVG